MRSVGRFHFSSVSIWGSSEAYVNFYAGPALFRPVLFGLALPYTALPFY